MINDCWRRRRHQFAPSVRARLTELAKSRDNWHGPLAALSDLLIIAVTFWAASKFWLFVPIAVLLLGTRQRAHATLLHEAAHFTLARSRTVCILIGCFAGWAVFQTFWRYRESHCMEHHPQLGDPKQDPDLLNYERQALFDQKPAVFIRQHLREVFLGRKILPNLRNLIIDRLVPVDFNKLPIVARLEYVGFVLFWITLISTSIVFDKLLLLLLWGLAYLTVFQTLNWLIELAEHFPLLRMSDSELEMTRNREGNWIEDFITGMHGEKWHLVHHLHPGIPFWRLREAHFVMLQDEQYASANASNGGVFTRGRSGAPSILGRMGVELANYQAQRSKA